MVSLHSENLPRWVFNRYKMSQRLGCQLGRMWWEVNEVSNLLLINLMTSLGCFNNRLLHYTIFSGYIFFPHHYWKVCSYKCHYDKVFTSHNEKVLNFLNKNEDDEQCKFIFKQLLWLNECFWWIRHVFTKIFSFIKSF